MMPMPVRYQPPTSMTMSSQRTSPYWDAIKIAEINPSSGKSTVPSMTRRRVSESSSACSLVVGSGESEQGLIGTWESAFCRFSVVDDFEIVGRDECRVRLSACSRQLQHFFPQGNDIVSYPSTLKSGIETTHQPLVLSCNTGRTMSGVTALCLDAANGKHRFASDVDHIAAESHGE